MVPFKLMVYVEDSDSYLPVAEVPAGRRTLDLSGTELRERLAAERETRPRSLPSPGAAPASRSTRKEEDAGLTFRLHLKVVVL